MALAISTSLSDVTSKIADLTVFKDGMHPFEDRISTLPGDSTKLIIFESMIRGKVLHPDLALCFTKTDFDLLADWCSSVSPETDSGNYWSHIKDLVKGKVYSLQEHLKLVWIEMDLIDNDKRGIQKPGFFLEFLEDKRDPAFISRQIVPIMTGNDQHPSCKSAEFCLSQLPDTGQLIHLGYFPSRSKDKLRLTLLFSHYEDIPPYCARVFGRELNEEIRTRIEEFSRFSDFGVLHLDIGSEIEPRLGIELRFRENDQDPAFQWRWRKVFSWLIDQGHCSSKTAESFLGFSGTTRFIDNSMIPSWYKYYLYYIKGVFDFSGNEHYKAYCGFRRLTPE